MTHKVLNGPWRPRPVSNGSPPNGRLDALLRASLVAAIALLAGFVAHAWLTTEPKEEVPPYGPSIGPTEQAGNGGRYFRGDDLDEGVWRTEVPAGEQCGYRRTAQGARVTDSAVRGPGTLTVVLDGNTLYVDLDGPCVWKWMGP